MAPKDKNRKREANRYFMSIDVYFQN